MSQTNPNPTPPNHNKKKQIINKVVVPIVVAVLGGTGFWQLIQWFLQNQNDSQPCQIKADDISLAKTRIEVNQSFEVSIRADNPDGNPLLYNWRAVSGTMNPNVRSGSPQSTYTAPSQPVDDTISVELTLPGCQSVNKKKQISVTSPSSKPTPTPPKQSTLVPSTPPNNSSPSPKPTQQNRVVYKEDFEDKQLSGKILSNHVSLTKGKTGTGLKVSHLDKSENWGVRAVQMDEVFKAGKTYQASVWCKANKGEECMIALVDDTKANNTKEYENKFESVAAGTGDWQKITTLKKPMSHDEYMSVYVYSRVLGASVTYDDILVEEVVNQ